jgi:hypothetical protein
MPRVACAGDRLQSDLQRADVLFTTDAIILEFLAAFSGAGAYFRQQAATRVEAMWVNPYLHVIEVTRAQLLEGLALYKNRHNFPTPCASG